jgi:hypothetical protein
MRRIAPTTTDTAEMKRENYRPSPFHPTILTLHNSHRFGKYFERNELAFIIAQVKPTTK